MKHMSIFFKTRVKHINYFSEFESPFLFFGGSQQNFNLRWSLAVIGSSFVAGSGFATAASWSAPETSGRTLTGLGR